MGMTGSFLEPHSPSFGKICILFEMKKMCSWEKSVGISKLMDEDPFPSFKPRTFFPHFLACIGIKTAIMSI